MGKMAKTITIIYIHTLSHKTKPTNQTIITPKPKPKHKHKQYKHTLTNAQYT